MTEAKEEFREPFADIRETETGAKLIVELPGVPQDSIKMEVSRDLVTVVGKGSRGSFKTIQVMPFDPDPENIAVTYSQGVLEVDVRRSEHLKEGEKPPVAKGPLEIKTREDVEKDLDGLTAELAAVSEEKAILEDRTRILQRDFLNLKRRHEKEKESIADRKIRDISLGLVEVIDDFERARSSVIRSGCPRATSDNILKGLEMVEGRVHSLFDSIGIKRIQSLGIHFDPIFHEAVGQSQDPDVDDDIITQERICGFFYKEDALRPAQVIVNKRPVRPAKDDKKKKR